MNPRTLLSALIFYFVLLFAEPSAAAETENATLLQDLTSVIMLLGMPCNQVISAKQQTENDHIATCSNGDAYRVFLNTEGRVVALKQ